MAAFTALTAYERTPGGAKAVSVAGVVLPAVGALVLAHTLALTAR